MTDSTNNTNETNTLTTQELTELENRLRADVDSGKLDTDGVWALISYHTEAASSKFEWKPSASVAMMAFILRNMPVTLDQLLEGSNNNERFVKIKTVMGMLEDSIWSKYNVKNCMEEHEDLVRGVWAEINCFMAVTDIFQDLCYMSAFLNTISSNMVTCWSELIEEKGPSEDALKGLQVWQEVAAAAELANSMI